MAVNAESTRITITMSKKLKKALDIISQEDDRSISQYVNEITEAKVWERIESIKIDKLKLWAVCLLHDATIKGMILKEFENPERYKGHEEDAEKFKNFSEAKKEELLIEYVLTNLKDSLINAYDIDKIFEL